MLSDLCRLMLAKRALRYQQRLRADAAFREVPAPPAGLVTRLPQRGGTRLVHLVRREGRDLST